MKNTIHFLFIITLLTFGCERSISVIPEAQSNSGLEGQVYANAGPGFHPIAMKVTIVVLKNDSTSEVTEAKSDSNGVYKISLDPGNYILYVKESHDIYYSGPFEVTEGSYTESMAYLYDARIVKLK